MGVIQAAVLEVLADAELPMKRRDIHTFVERRLRRKVSMDTVGSFLSVAARAGSTPVGRVSPGVYRSSASQE